MARIATVLGLGVAALACGPTNAKRDMYLEHKSDHCPARCAENEQCNLALPTWPCMPEHSQRLGEKCSDPINCAKGLTCDTKTFHCIEP